MLFIAALTAVPSAIAFVGIMIADYKATQKKKSETSPEQVESNKIKTFVKNATCIYKVVRGFEKSFVFR